MKKFIIGMMAAVATAVPVLADPITEEDYKTPHAMGCMLVQECTDGVIEIKSLADVEAVYGTDFSAISRSEFDDIVRLSNSVGVNVYLAPGKYFPSLHRGVYYTNGNNFFLNDTYMGTPGVLMSVLRHEGWHAAQDCMAGGIENTFMGVIYTDEEVPGMWKELVENTYPAPVRPWEQEASWAGRTEGMTRDALSACAAGPMWEHMDPTPMTLEWLTTNGYITR